MLRLAGGGSCSRNDVVLFNCTAGVAVGRIWLIASVNGTMIVLVDTWRPLRREAETGTIVWASSPGHRAFVHAVDILEPVICCEIRPGEVRTILPWMHRSAKVTEYSA